MVVEPEAGMEVGLNEADAPVGNPLTVNDPTVPVKPTIAVLVTV
jgi:hypothetical protein